MDFKPQEQVVVSVPQLHGKSSVLEQGEILSIHGQEASVVLQGEDIPRTVPLDRLSHIEETYGQEYSGRPNEMPVLNQIRG